MWIVRKGDKCKGTFIYRGTCSCGCEVLVPEKEVISEAWEGSDGYTNYDRYCRCPMRFCEERIDLKPDRYVTAEEYDDLGRE